MKNALLILLFIFSTSLCVAAEKKITLNVIANGKKEKIEITSYETNQKGYIFWTEHGIINEYELLKIDKSKTCINFWLKFNYFNVRASLLIKNNKLIINVAGNKREYDASTQEIKKINDFKELINVPSVTDCFDKTDTKNSFIETAHESINKESINVGTGCGYTLTPEQRVELIKEGFLLEDSNHQGYNTFSKLNYVFPDKVYAKHYNGEIWRIVYLGQPSIIKHYVGKKYTCGGAIGYPINGVKRYLKHVNLGSIEILDNYQP